MDTIRILRIVEYIGPRDQVENIVCLAVHGTRRGTGDVMIRATTLGEFPDVLTQTEIAALPKPTLTVGQADHVTDEDNQAMHDYWAKRGSLGLSSGAEYDARMAAKDDDLPDEDLIGNRTMAYPSAEPFSCDCGSSEFYHPARYRCFRCGKTYIRRDGQYHEEVR